MGKREYISGILFGREVVAVFSRWGKSAAAATTATLINMFEVSEILFTGVAGGIKSGLDVGDIVIGDYLYHHDFDASPIVPRYHVPLIGENGIQCHQGHAKGLLKAAEEFVPHLDEFIPHEDILEFSLQKVQVLHGNIATGDQFIKDEHIREEILQNLPDIHCVEMEGAAVAQICWEHDMPFSIMRTISDNADTHAPIDFPKFIEEVASIYSFEIIKRYFQQ